MGRETGAKSDSKPGKRRHIVPNRLITNGMLWRHQDDLPASLASGAAMVDFVGASVLPGGDINRSNLVDIEDYFRLAGVWHKRNSAADIDGNGFVETNDCSILAARCYQQGRPRKTMR
jgi:hypothetical protein